MPLVRELKTPRGPYRLRTREEPTNESQGWLFPLSIESSSGIERVAFDVAISAELARNTTAEAVFVVLGAWIEQMFEVVREAALKSVRGEHRLWRLVFDASEPGPFKPN